METLPCGTETPKASGTAVGRLSVRDSPGYKSWQLAAFEQRMSLFLFYSDSPSGALTSGRCFWWNNAGNTAPVYLYTIFLSISSFYIFEEISSKGSYEPADWRTGWLGRKSWLVYVFLVPPTSSTSLPQSSESHSGLGLSCPSGGEGEILTWPFGTLEVSGWPVFLRTFPDLSFHGNVIVKPYALSWPRSPRLCTAFCRMGGVLCASPPPQRHTQSSRCLSASPAVRELLFFSETR